MTARDFAAALARFDAAARGLDALEQRLPVVVAERRAAAQLAFAAGRAAEAIEKYAALLKVAPDDAAARSGLARARVLDDVVRETAAGARAEQAGDTQAAVAAYRRALQLDPATDAARAGIARLQARETSDAYATAMAEALAALARKDYVAAQGSFERAGRIRPGTPEVAEGIAADTARWARRAVSPAPSSARLRPNARSSGRRRWPCTVRRSRSNPRCRRPRPGSSAPSRAP